MASWFGNSTLAPTATTVTRGRKALLFIVTVTAAGRARAGGGPSTQTTASAVSCARWPSFSSTSTLPRSVLAPRALAGTASTSAMEKAQLPRLLRACLRRIPASLASPERYNRAPA
jgi:hypothetical protein